MDVSIIFVNYKTNDLLYQAIESIKKYTSDCTYEIIVVDNSEDNTIFEDLLYNKDKYNYKVINSHGNLGVGNGGNLGSKFATGDYLLFLNTDVIFISNAVFILLDFIKHNVDAGIVGANLYKKDLSPNLTFVDEEINQYLTKRPFNFFGWAFSKLKIKPKTFNFTNKPHIVKNMIIGATLMISRNDFLKLGGFDKDIFMYGEEALLCYRVRKELNKKIYNIPEAKVIHLDGGSYKEASRSREMARVNGDFVYYSKSLGKASALNVYRNLSKILLMKIFLSSVCFNKKKCALYKLRRSIYLDKIKNNE